NGYVEESPMPRLYREAPVNAIWEGSGNVIALDVLRAAKRDEDAAFGLLHQLLEQTRGLPGGPETVLTIQSALLSDDLEPRARHIADRLYHLAAAAALTRSAPPAIAEAFAQTRLAQPARMIGANDLGPALKPLLDRAFTTI
ncbi:MAG: DNA alkylation response protein, partial [Microvirga sp.]